MKEKVKRIKEQVIKFYEKWDVLIILMLEKLLGKMKKKAGEK